MTDKPAADAVPREKAFDRIVDLIVNQDRVVHSWSGRYLTIQAGLMVAEFTLLNLQWHDDAHRPLALAAVILVPLAGISLALVITKIIQREFWWQRKYVAVLHRIETGGDIQILSWPEGEEKEEVDKRGAIETWFLVVMCLIISLWVMLLIVLLTNSDKLFIPTP